MMLDWTNYHQELLARLGEITRLSPDTIKGYQVLSGAGARTGQFDGKTRELIALACAVTLRCDGVITVHATAAVKHGATKEQLVEVLGVAIALGAGAALVYSVRTLEAFQAQTEALLATA